MNHKMKRVFEVYGLRTEEADGETYSYLVPHTHELFVDDDQDDGQREFANEIEVIEAVADFNQATGNANSEHFGKEKFYEEIVILQTLGFSPLYPAQEKKKKKEEE